MDSLEWPTNAIKMAVVGFQKGFTLETEKLLRPCEIQEKFT